NWLAQAPARRKTKAAKATPNRRARGREAVGGRPYAVGGGSRPRAAFRIAHNLSSVLILKGSQPLAPGCANGTTRGLLRAPALSSILKGSPQRSPATSLAAIQNTRRRTNASCSARAVLSTRGQLASPLAAVT